MSDEDILEKVEDAAKDYWASINDPTEVSDVRIIERLPDGAVRVAVMWYNHEMQDGDEMTYLLKDGELTLIDKP